MPARDPGPPPKEALEYFRGKGYRVGFDYRDVWREEHATAFTVAKAMKQDVLVAIREEVDRAIANGRTFEQFQKDLQPRLEKLGWWGRQAMVDPVTGKTVSAQLGSPRRLKTIYRANLRTARAAGQWQRAQRTKRALPFFLYLLGPSEVHREQHLGWEGMILPVDDPFWDTHFPPNGWGCKCHVRQITKRETDERGGQSERPSHEDVEWLNKRTGKIERVPKGIDPGWDTNPGKARQAQANKKASESDEEYKQKVAPTPKQPSPTQSEPENKPVSAALDVKARGETGKAVRRGIKAIDEVHDDGKLEKIPVGSNERMNSLGMIQHIGSKVLKMSIRGSGPWPELTVAHETGHVLDLLVLGEKGKWASHGHPIMARFMDAAKASQAVKKLKSKRDSSPNMRYFKFYEYQLQDHEIWARAYAQYIALRSSDEKLKAQVRLAHQQDDTRQWSDEDFVEIAAAIDDIIDAKGWLK